MNRSRIRWGIMGTGNIATQFASALKCLPHADLIAVGSRSFESAHRFGIQFEIAKRYSTYEELVKDETVQVIYIATPASQHYSHMMMALQNGKAVLCEKPFTINAQEAQGVIAFAREKKLFLMEAMWTRSLPAVGQLQAIVKSEVLGEISCLFADIGMNLPSDPTSRIYRPELGGGALLDLGVYLVSLDSMLFGRPTSMKARLVIGQTGVDETASFRLHHQGNCDAYMFSSINVQTPMKAVVCSSKGRIEMNSWWKSQSYHLSLKNKLPTTWQFPCLHNGYEYQAMAVMDALEQNLTECSVIPLEETLSIIETMDQIRRQAMRYPPHLTELEVAEDTYRNALL